MANMNRVRSLSLRELEQMTAARRADLNRLETLRAKLTGEIEEVDGQIAEIKGEGSPARTPRTQEASNQALKFRVHHAMIKANAAMRAADVAQAMRESGQKLPKNALSQIATTLGQNKDMFKRVRKGLYRPIRG